MIDLRPALNEALRNIQTWRNKYPAKVYPHKIVLNMMYRAYSTRIVYKAFQNDELVEQDDLQEAMRYVIYSYSQSAANEVHPYLEQWMATRPNEEVGTLCTSRYENLAKRAETDKSALEELEFSYIFELLNDMSVLYFIAFRLCGISEVDAISQMSGVIIEKLDFMDYTIAKQVFQQLLVAPYLHHNYRPLPE